MRNDYLQTALKVIDDPNILVNVVSRRVKQLRLGHRPLVESLEKLSLEDTALREIGERKITYVLGAPEEFELSTPERLKNTVRQTEYQPATAARVKTAPAVAETLILAKV